MRAELGQIEHIADEPLEPLGFGRDHRQGRDPQLLLRDDALAQRLDVAADRGQRRA